MQKPHHRLDKLTGRKAAEQLRLLRAAIEREVDQVADVVLFGSRARGTAKKESDFDIAVVIPPTENRRATTRVVSAIALPFIRAGYHFRPVVIDLLSLDSVDNPLANNIAREGISIT